VRNGIGCRGVDAANLQDIVGKVSPDPVLPWLAVDVLSSIDGVRIRQAELRGSGTVVRRARRLGSGPGVGLRCQDFVDDVGVLGKCCESVGVAERADEEGDLVRGVKERLRRLPLSDHGELVPRDHPRGTDGVVRVDVLKASRSQHVLGDVQAVTRDVGYGQRRLCRRREARTEEQGGTQCSRRGAAGRRRHRAPS